MKYRDLLEELNHILLPLVKAGRRGVIWNLWDFGSCLGVETCNGGAVIGGDMTDLGNVELCHVEGEHRWVCSR